jgi:hypothetical protein
MIEAARAQLALGTFAAVAIAAASAGTVASDPARRFVARWGGVTKDLGLAVAADAGSVFVTGATWSADFPVSTGKPPNGRTWCGFLTQLRTTDGALVRSSALCGLGMTYARAAAADGAGGVWVGGSSDGPELPASRNASQAGYGGGSTNGGGDAFVARWNPGGDLDYLTYLGGAGDETAWGVASDGAGGVWAVGSTTSRPLLSAVGDATRTGTQASADGFLAHIGSDRRLDAVKILGGNGVDELQDVALVDGRRLVVVGATASSDGALGPPRGGFDGLIAVLDAKTLEVSWVLRLGGTRNDVLRAVTVVDGGTIIAVGHTDGGACRPRLGGADGWVVAVSPAGSVLRSHCVGTAATDDLSAAAAAPDGAVWVTGTTSAARLRGGGGPEAYDRAFVSRLGPEGAAGPLRLLSNEISRGSGVAIDVRGTVYAVGQTTAVPSRNGPWTVALHPTGSAFRGNRPPGSTDPYVVALQP